MWCVLKLKGTQKILTVGGQSLLEYLVSLAERFQMMQSDLKLPKPAPEPEPPEQPTARVARGKKKKAGEHVQVFRMPHSRKKGVFYSKLRRVWTLQYVTFFALFASFAVCAWGCAPRPTRGLGRGAGGGCACP